MAFKTPSELSKKTRELLSSETDEMLAYLENYADQFNIPVLLPESVALLKQLVMLKQPKEVLEIGTAIGYSGLIMLKSCDCRLTTLEIDDERVEFARDVFAKCGYAGKAVVFNGDAAEILPSLEKQYDFIFLDGAKSQYINYLPLLKRLLNDGGVLLCDNVLFTPKDGDSKKKQLKAESIIEKLDLFLESLFSDKQLVSSLLPVGDGMSLSIKKL